jgi:hypothetical protein
MKFSRESRRNTAISVLSRCVHPSSGGKKQRLAPWYEFHVRGGGTLARKRSDQIPIQGLKPPVRNHTDSIFNAVRGGGHGGKDARELKVPLYPIVVIAQEETNRNSMIQIGRVPFTHCYYSFELFSKDFHVMAVFLPEWYFPACSVNRGAPYQRTSQTSGGDSANWPQANRTLKDFSN